MERDRYPLSSYPAEVSSHLGRRYLLKVLGATGGVLAAGTPLPAHWIKPLVEIGYRNYSAVLREQ